MIRSRARWALLVAAILAGVLLPQSASAQECADLPRSSLKMYRLTVDQVTEHTATRAEIKDIVTALAGTPSAHPLMAICRRYRYACCRRASGCRATPGLL